jgi:lysophospholipase L1-like esterase
MINFFKKKFFRITIYFEIIGILVIGVYLYSTLVLKKNVLGAKTVYSPILKEYLINSPSSELKYYFEYQPSKDVDFKPDWATEKVTYTINADTLNERYNYPVKKPPNTYRIITLGDSFTFGVGVNTKDNWPEQLEDMLNKSLPCGPTKKIEVINLGMGSYGVEYISHRYLTRGVKYNPDLIMWFESDSGFDRINELFETYREKAAAAITDAQKEEARKNGDFFLDWKLGMEAMQKDYTISQLFDMAKSSWQNFFDNVRGQTPVIVSIPQDVETGRIDLLKSWIGTRQGILLDDSIQSVNIKELQLQDGHPNVQGQEAIADKMSKYLINNSIIHCEK